MAFTIQEQLLKNNRPGTIIAPRGIVVHDTDDPGATAQNLHDYWNTSPQAQASAHYVIDWDSIIRLIPENEKAWHAGKTANNLYLSFEMCVPASHDAVKFQAVWDKAVWLTADILKRHNWSIDVLFTHNDISNMYRETDHTDPIAYFKEYEKSWVDFKNDTSIALKGEADMKKIVIYFGDVDALAAIIVSQKYQCPLMKKSDFEASGLKADEVVQIGGKPDSTRFTTFKDAGELVV